MIIILLNNWSNNDNEKIMYSIQNIDFLFNITNKKDFNAHKSILNLCKLFCFNSLFIYVFKL